MAERMFTKQLGRLVVDAVFIEPAAHPLSHVVIHEAGAAHQPLVRLDHDEARDLHYALGRILEEQAAAERQRAA